MYIIPKIIIIYIDGRFKQNSGFPKINLRKLQKNLTIYSIKKTINNKNRKSQNNKFVAAF